VVDREREEVVTPEDEQRMYSLLLKLDHGVEFDPANWEWMCKFDTDTFEWYRVKFSVGAYVTDEAREWMRAHEERRLKEGQDND
jgi:hypothetical protein